MTAGCSEVTTTSLRSLPKESQLLFPGDKDTNRPQVSSYNASLLVLLLVLLRGRTAELSAAMATLPCLARSEEG